MFEIKTNNIYDMNNIFYDMKSIHHMSEIIQPNSIYYMIY